MRVPLIDGQGNFGSVDGDPPAAMRYTEVRLAKPAMALLEDIDKDTVDFQANYDGSEQEPARPAGALPQPPRQRRRRHRRRHGHQHPAAQSRRGDRRLHRLIDDPSISIDDLIAIVPGPDFPTGGTILGRAGIRAAYHTGRGSVIMRGQVARRDDAQGPRGDHLHRDPVSGEQGDAGREDRRARARQAHRGHLRPSRRDPTATACASSSS